MNAPTIDQNKKLLAQGKVSEAIDNLMDIAQYDQSGLYNNLIALKSNYNRVKKEEISGVLAPEEIQLQTNRILEALLEIIEKINPDNNQIVISEIRTLIANNRLEDAVDQLQKFIEQQGPNLDDDYLNQTVLLSSRINQLKANQVRGYLTNDELNLENNKIISGLLALLDEINKPKGRERNTGNGKQEEIILNNRIAEILNEPVEKLYEFQRQVVPIFGDLFEAQFDLLIIPQDAHGNLSPSMEEGLGRLGYVHSSRKSDWGALRLLPQTKKGAQNDGRVLYATSVSEESNSSLETIQNIAINLGERSKGFKNIATPLLGTGYGGLDKLQAFLALEKGFLNTAEKDAYLYVHIIDKDAFLTIQQYLLRRQFGDPNPKRATYNADALGGKDKLDIMHEVKAFANLIASETLEPPLSVGLFGNWGTGKSFFMEKLHDEVAEISGFHDPTKRLPGVCKRVAQIKFNAWHFVDANLWASMVNTIFNELGTFLNIKTPEEQKELNLYKELATTQEQIKLAEAEKNEIDREIKALDQKLEDLMAIRQKKREHLEGVKLEHLFNEIKEDEEVAKLIDKAKDKIGFTKLKKAQGEAEQSIEELNGLITRYRSTQGKVMQIIRSILSLKSWRTILVFIVLIAIPILAFNHFPIFFPDPNDSNWNWNPYISLVGNTISVLTAISLFIKQLIEKADPILQQVNIGVDYLQKAKTRLQHLQDVASSHTDDQIAALQDEYAQLNEEHQKFIAQKWAAQKRLELLNKELDEIREGKKLRSFIQERLSSNEYQKYLGIISFIRKDFDRLSGYMDIPRDLILLKKLFPGIEQGDITNLEDHFNKIKQISSGTLPSKKVNVEEGELEKLNDFLKEHPDFAALKKVVMDIEERDQVDRIILYIDDLDRCPPERVVEVLQAIHLILAFPLFVVVVGVDVRWVSKSLIRKYGDMFTHYEGDLTVAPEVKKELRGSATPFDYLEKIFQIPFKLKQITDSDKKRFFRHLLTNDIEKGISPIEEKEDHSEEQKQENNSIEQKDIGPSTPTKISSAQKIEQNTDREASKENKKEQVETPPTPSKEITPPSEPSLKEIENESAGIKPWETVKLSGTEFEFILQLTPIAGKSARTLKRFVNVARLIKSNNKWLLEPDRLETNTIPFHAYLVMLAVVIGSPWMSPLFFSLLKKEKEADTLGKLIQVKEEKIGKDIDKHDLINEEWDNFRHFLIQAKDHKNLDVRAIYYYDLDYLRKIAPVVSRFSFRVAQEEFAEI